MLESAVALGYEVHLVTVASDEPYAVKGVAVHVAPRLPFCGRLPERASLRRYAVNALLLLKAVAAARRSRCDIIHGVDDCGVVAWVVGLLTRRPYVCDVQDGVGAEPVVWFRRGLRKASVALSRLALKWARAVIVENPDAAAALARQGCGARACVIPDIPALTGDVPAPVLNLARASYGTLAGKKVVTCVGAHNHFRGLTMFFNAVPFVLREDPGVQFVVAGGTKAQAEGMRKALEQAGVAAGSVVLTGCLPPTYLTALLTVSDIVVAPCCAGAAVPIRVLDGLYLSRPLVVVDTGFSKTIFSSHNALVVDANHEALAQGILYLCRNEPFAEGLALRGHETLLVQHRTPEAFRESLRQCYAYAMAGRAADVPGG
jgi:glycosyltransferase involved in cell wall biosynthesis